MTVHLGSVKREFIKGVGEYRLPEIDKDRWIAYRLQKSEGEVILQDLLTGTSLRFEGVEDYLFDKWGTHFVLVTSAQDHNNSKKYLKWVDLHSNSVSNIWSAQSPDQSVQGITFDEGGKKNCILASAQCGFKREIFDLVF